VSALGRPAQGAPRSPDLGASPAPAAARVAIALGANQGRPRQQLLAAIAELSRALGALAVAPLYSSAAVSPIAQPDFLNSVILARTALAPEPLLALLKRLERDAGRVPGERWGPRPLDLDLLVWGDLELVSPDLIVPHPRLRERGFVLAPLAAIAPTLRVPRGGAEVTELLAALPVTERPRQVPWNADAP
jgi:2-amino-4-hydroxy-6-hydroxymethyldihydropteridine diphosphokinase